MIFYYMQLYFIWKKCIQCGNWITGVFSHDIAAILPFTALYVQPKCSHTICVQYTIFKQVFFDTTLYCKTAYFTWKNWVQCAYGVFLHCTECALNNGCFIQRYCSDPAMYGTLPAAQHSLYWTCNTSWTCLIPLSIGQLRHVTCLTLSHWSILGRLSLWWGRCYMLRHSCSA